MNLLETILVSVAVLFVSGATAVGLGHFFLSVLIKDRRTS